MNDYSREQRAGQPCLHGYLVTASRGAECLWHSVSANRSGALAKYPAPWGVANLIPVACSGGFDCTLIITVKF